MGISMLHQRANHSKRRNVRDGLLMTVLIFSLAISAKATLDKKGNETKTSTAKKILTWNDFFGARHFGASLGNSAFKFCKVNDCEIWDRLDQEPDLPLDQYDAVVFHGIDTSNDKLPPNISDLPKLQNPNQRYVFVLQESPIMRPQIYGFKNFFNWTATYRRDSDILLQFIDIQKIDMRGDSDRVSTWREPSFENMSHIPDFVLNKSKLVAWFTSNSNTQSKRDLYVEELSKHIEVDIYGMGRKLSCAHGENCDLMLDETYKFYLAFENSLCEDYITEKFNRPIRHYVVPIVYGGADYKAFAPKLSYINVKDFSSPKELAKYLLYLDDHPGEYLKYFWWKRFYIQTGRNWWCDICEKLHNQSEPNRVYPDMEQWWNSPSICKTPEEEFSKSFYSALYMNYPDIEPWWIEKDTCAIRTKEEVSLTQQQEQLKSEDLMPKMGDKPLRS